MSSVSSESSVESWEQMGHLHVFRMPAASLIRPRLTRDETLSLLYDINTSRSPSRRLPNELLLHVNNYIHTNSIYEQIRSDWTPISVPSDRSKWYFIHDYTYEHADELPLARAEIDRSKGLFYIPQCENTSEDTSIASGQGIHKMFSSPDLLYRILCFFPEASIRHRYSSNRWSTYLQHKRTGMGIEFWEENDTYTEVLVSVNWGESLQSEVPDPYHFTPRQYEDLSSEEKWLRDRMSEVGITFSEDAVALLNAFVGVSMDDGSRDRDESRQFAYFHPSADADIPMTSSDDYCPVLPQTWGADAGLYRSDLWVHREQVPPSVPPSAASSLLPLLKYNTQSLQVEIRSTTSNENIILLTNTISSSLLFYQLMCVFKPIKPEPIIQKHTPVTSVWQIELIHRDSGTSVTFLDDRGLFDIRIAKGDKPEIEMTVVLRDIVELLNDRLQEEAIDPYDDDFTQYFASFRG